MAVTILANDLETYIGQYGTHGAIQRLQFIGSKAERPPLKIEASRLRLELLKRTTNTKGYTEAYSTLKELLDGNDVAPPEYDTVWVEATQKQASILKEVYEQDLHQAKTAQNKEAIRTCHTTMANFLSEQGDYASALKYISKSREYCSDPMAVFSTCIAIIRLSALQRQYSDIQSFASKAHHSSGQCRDEGPDRRPTAASKICAANGLYFMTSGKYKDAALSFAQVEPRDLGAVLGDVLGPQDVALYGALCALASLDRGEVQSKVLDSQSFGQCLDLVPQVRELISDFCCCKYAACLSSLEQLSEALHLDVHLHSHVADICQQVRSKAMVQYFVPFLSVSLHSMAEAFNTDVDGIQAEAAKLISGGQLDAKIDSQKKVLHVRHANQRKAAYQKTMRMSQEFYETTQALVLRMNLLKHDFGVHVVRQKK